jgi:hypothetical protein
MEELHIELVVFHDQNGLGHVSAVLTPFPAVSGGFSALSLFRSA